MHMQMQCLPVSPSPLLFRGTCQSIFKPIDFCLVEPDVEGLSNFSPVSFFLLQTLYLVLLMASIFVKFISVKFHFVLYIECLGVLDSLKLIIVA